MTELSDYMRLVSGPQQERLHDRIRDLSDALAASEAARERAESAMDILLGLFTEEGEFSPNLHCNVPRAVQIARDVHMGQAAALTTDQQTGGAAALVQPAGETGGGEHG